MRNYEYTEKWKQLLTPEIVRYIAAIHEYKGEQGMVVCRYGHVLEALTETARIQSSGSSNRIEGIYTSDERLRKLVQEKTIPKNRNEQEIAGYRDVLNTIHENSAYIPLKSPVILQLHRDLYRYEDSSFGGSFKSVDNLIEEVDTDGRSVVRFRPVSAWETPESVERLCAAYNRAISEDESEPLILIFMFVLDFLCIHPFLDGNGRMSRLLTLLLLYRSGFVIGRFISIEKLIEDTKEEYYEALLKSSAGWHEGENDYVPFVSYMLGVLAAACREFSDRTKWLEQKKMSKPERVEEEIRYHLGTITKSELTDRLPDVSQSTVEQALANLKKEGKILKINSGRYTKYAWNWESEDI